MKFTKGFWISFGIMILLFIIPTIIRFGAPDYDGQALLGFPLPFYSWGGLCPSLNSVTGGEICSSFSLSNLIVDIIILVGVPFTANLIILRRK